MRTRSQSRIVYRDKFGTGGIASPRLGAPGSATITQADGSFSIANGRLALGQQSSYTAGDLQLRCRVDTGGAFGETVARSERWPIACKFSQSAGEWYFGYDATSALGANREAMWTSAISGGLQHLTPGIGTALYQFAAGAVTHFLIQPKGTQGAFYLARGESKPWLLLAHTHSGGTDDLYGGLASKDGVGGVDEIGVLTEPLKLRPEYDLTSPTMGEIYPIVPFCLHEFRVTQSGSLAEGDVAEYAYDYADANNYNAIYTEVQGDLSVRLKTKSVVGGVPSAVSSLALTGIGASDAIYVQMVTQADGLGYAWWRPDYDSTVWLPAYPTRVNCPHSGRPYARFSVAGGAPSIQDWLVYEHIRNEIPTHVIANW